MHMNTNTLIHMHKRNSIQLPESLLQELQQGRGIKPKHYTLYSTQALHWPEETSTMLHIHSSLSRVLLICDLLTLSQTKKNPEYFYIYRVSEETADLRSWFISKGYGHALFNSKPIQLWVLSKKLPILGSAIFLLKSELGTTWIPGTTWIKGEGHHNLSTLVKVPCDKHWLYNWQQKTSN